MFNVFVNVTGRFMPVSLMLNSVERFSDIQMMHVLHFSQKQLRMVSYATLWAAHTWEHMYVLSNVAGLHLSCAEPGFS